MDCKLDDHNPNRYDMCNTRTSVAVGHRIGLLFWRRHQPFAYAGYVIASTYFLVIILNTLF